MLTLSEYLAEYAESHKNLINIRIHLICVPLIMWSLLGLLHAFRTNGDIHLSHIVACIGILFYVYLDHWRVTVGMVVITGFMLLVLEFIPYLTITSAMVFILAWIGQFFGHKIEGRKPSFFKDLFFLLIGPVWILKKAFPNLVY